MKKKTLADAVKELDGNLSNTANSKFNNHHNPNNWLYRIGGQWKVSRPNQVRDELGLYSVGTVAEFYELASIMYTQGE